MPNDIRVENKEVEKISKYKGLQKENERLWHKVKRILLIKVLGCHPKTAGKALEHN